MSTIRDVAKLAGVSPASVSRILANDATYKVSPETVANVMAAVKKLNYSIPPAYRSRRKKIKFGVINRVTEERTKDSYYSTILDGIKQFCDENNIEIEILQSQFDLSVPKVLENFLNSDLRGVIVMGETDDEVIEIIHQSNLSAVGIDNNSEKIDNVKYNRYQAGCMAMEYLIANGHKSIAYIGSHIPNRRIAEMGRFDAYKKMLSTIDQPINEAWIIDCEWKRQVCHNKTIQLLSNPNRPTAIFVASDHMAIAAMSAIAEAGLRIPDDISIIGITDIEASKYMNPPLTTVKLPQKEIGLIAANDLLQRVNGDKTVVKQIFVPTELVERKSVKLIR